ncbi:hypothetical protein CYMTET_29279, partial [Cymbomonas tetramitiformis]
ALLIYAAGCQVSGNGMLWTEEPDPQALPKGSLSEAWAIWATADSILWRGPPKGRDTHGLQFKLHQSWTADLELQAEGVTGGDTPLTLTAAGSVSADVGARFPQYAEYTVLKLPPGVDVAAVVRHQLAISVLNEDGEPVDAMGVQLTGVLDDCFEYSGPLGAALCREGVEIHLWAPTAQRVSLLRYASAVGDDVAETIPMAEEAGVWSAKGPVAWAGSYYQYQVEVYCPWTLRVERSISTDPYSRSLSANGGRTQIASLDEAALKPKGWDALGHSKPALEAFTDITLYELHIRDFSALDDSLPEAARGTYSAFCDPAASGVRHLQGLAAAGLSHVHLLPSYDFGSVDERKDTWRDPEGDLGAMDCAGREQQAAVGAIQNCDGFNWGYDPVHYGVPDGSYASDPDGTARVVEFRSMVQLTIKEMVRVIKLNMNAECTPCLPIESFAVAGVEPSSSLRSEVRPAALHMPLNALQVEAPAAMDDTTSGTWRTAGRTSDLKEDDGSTPTTAKDSMGRQGVHSAFMFSLITRTISLM